MENNTKGRRVMAKTDGAWFTHQICRTPENAIKELAKLGRKVADRKAKVAANKANSTDRLWARYTEWKID